MNLNFLKNKLIDEIENIVARNTQVSSKACEDIKKSNGQIPKAFSDCNKEIPVNN
jgi:hypothetical protein